MKPARSSGVLLHPTALPGPHGIGSFGAEARAFVDFLAAAGQSIWQILPLGPTGFGDSPYNALSAQAGNPLLVDLPTLAAWGDLDPAEAADLGDAPGRVDFAAAHRVKEELLARAAGNFLARADAARQAAFAAYCRDQAAWLDDYALFAALRREFGGQSWQEWPISLRQRDPATLATWRNRLAGEIAAERYRQFAFAVQWAELKAYANRRRVRIFGDLPIFVALDSADVWANQRLFRLDAAGRPTVVAGVPPDYFSANGQRWGNPLYRWEIHRAEGFAWWLQRFHAELQRCDLVRVDHFRGFQACWSIPATEPTAVHGQWEETPGRALFLALRAVCPEPPIVAEDLGIITPEVEALRTEFGFPGMKILQFAFDSGPDNPYLPHNFAADCVVYTGTHDNATTLGWWQGLTAGQRGRIAAYLGTNHPAIPADLIRLALASVARMCILPCQDLLGLDDAARFNRPGEGGGNWNWRLCPGQLTAELAGHLRGLTETYNRLPADI
ncbi:MAG: 4-alpha-glucanotransferase [Deltaproteobacteria bacterium]|nr:MAG: 4-alpha-glucanotransferase [Deltaproteobacteria bacterium]